MSYGSRLTAQRKGAWAARANANPLWDLSKRELIEVALHLAAQNSGAYDDALESGQATKLVLDERKALKRAGLI